MYADATSSVRINNTFREKFPKVGVHQGLVLSPLLFVIVIVIGIISRLPTWTPSDLLYADDLAIMDESSGGLLN